MLRRGLPVVAGAAAAVAVAAGIAFAAERTPHANYILRCAGCHGMEGAGVPAGGIPALQDLVGYFAADDDGRTYLLHVPGVVGSSLSNGEIAAVMNYVMERWAGRSMPPNFVPFTEAEVTERRAIPVPNVVDYRRAVVARLDAAGIAVAAYPWP